MRAPLVIGLAVVGTALFGCGRSDDPTLPPPPGDPLRYWCMWTDQEPILDGRLDDTAWLIADWSAHFVDIEGPTHPAPRYRTRAKMIWDNEALYIAAELEEPHVWATLIERDSVIYHDNDFEVFLDPDGDQRQYMELEINALGTEWDLRLTRPYRQDGRAIDAWDFAGLRTAVHIEGTLNDPTDTDRGWSVEIAIPWAAMAEYAGRPVPPRPGDEWRVNFSRVEWQTDVLDGGYVKRVDPESGKPLAENNWVWSPQGLIDMHLPERWGVVRFTKEGVQ